MGSAFGYVWIFKWWLLKGEIKWLWGKSEFAFIWMFQYVFYYIYKCHRIFIDMGWTGYIFKTNI